MSAKRFLIGARFVALAVLVVGLPCTGARAQTILFVNATPDLGADGAAGEFADTGNASGYYAAGDVFTPTVAGTVGTISFAGFYYNNGTPTAQPADSFTIYLYSVTAGTMGAPDAPNALISQATLSHETSSLIATSTNGFPIYQYSGDLTTATPFTLNTSTEYYIGIGDTTTPFVDFSLDFALNYIGPATDGWQLASPTSPAGGNSPIGFPAPFYFSLVAPEPSTGAMLLGGLSLLGARRWRTGPALV
jgi:hypothetical protein